MIDIFYPASSLTTYLSGVVNRTVLLFLLLVSLQRVALSIVLRGTRSAYAAPFLHGFVSLRSEAMVKVHMVDGDCEASD